MARSLHPKLAIFDSDKPDKEIASFFAVPSFFTDFLMMPHVSKGIPYSFWKFTFVILREMLAPGKEGHTYEFDTTSEWFLQEFGIDTGATQDWSNTYSVSGLFAMSKGKRHDYQKPGTPTHWRYNTAATSKDWIAFLQALSAVINRPNGKRIKRHGTGAEGLVAADAFKIMLACEVDRKRAAVNGTAGPPLPPVNTHKIDKWVSEGKAKAVRQEDGHFEYQYALPTWNGDNDAFHRRWGT